MFKKILCKIGWHFPSKIVQSGVNMRSTCKNCERDILQDSQGNWFTYN